MQQWHKILTYVGYKGAPPVWMEEHQEDLNLLAHCISENYI